MSTHDDDISHELFEDLAALSRREEGELARFAEVVARLRASERPLEFDHEAIWRNVRQRLDACETPPEVDGEP